MDRAVTPASLRLRAVPGLPIVAPGDDLPALIDDAAKREGLALSRGVLVVAQKIVSKAEGRLVALGDVEPGAQARAIAAEEDKDPRQVEVVLRESTRIVRRGHGVLICETRHGFVCANAGVDLSNAPGDDVAVLLPEDPDRSARELRAGLLARGHDHVAVIVTDTFGRPWREGLVDMAIGSAGLPPIDDLRGSADLAGRELAVTTNATVDQLAAAAGLLMGKGSGTPCVWVEGLEVPAEAEGGVQDVLRDPAMDFFR